MKHSLATGAYPRRNVGRRQCGMGAHNHYQLSNMGRVHWTRQKLTPFVDALPLPVTQSPMAAGLPNSRLDAEDAPYYRVRIREIEASLHRDLPLTRLWGYGATSAPVLFEARSQPGSSHRLDQRSSGKALPSAWMLRITEWSRSADTHCSPHARCARAVDQRRIPRRLVRTRRTSSLCFYPEPQDATALWAHDHAMGVSRFNVLAGLMGW